MNVLRKLPVTIVCCCIETNGINRRLKIKEMSRKDSVPDQIVRPVHVYFKDCLERK